MYKKAISIMSVMLIVFLCSYFPIHALEYISYTDYFTYDYGDVSISAQLMGATGDPGNSYNYQDNVIQYNFSVTLTNKTNQFQVADVNTFSFNFNTGVSGYFTVGNYKTGYSGFQLVDSSDNTKDISWQVYSDYMRFYFKDAELLVLNPNETRSYNFTFNQVITYNSNYNWINNSIVYSYMTSSTSSSITITNRPSTWSANTIEDFLNNDSLPNSAIAYLSGLISEQGIANETLSDIYNYLLLNYPNTVTNLSNLSTRYSGSSNNKDLLDENNVVKGRLYSNVIVFNPVPVDVEHNILNFDTSNINFEDYQVLAVPILYHVHIRNFTTSQSYYLSQTFIKFSNIPNITLANSYKMGSKYDFSDISGGLSLNAIYNDSMDIGFTQYYDQKAMLYANEYEYFNIIEYRYFVVDRIATGNMVNYRDLINSVTYQSTIFNDITLITNNLGWDSNDKNVFNQIKDKLQEILNGYNTNQPAASDVDQGSNAIQDESDDNHQTELSYFDQTNQALSTTGLENYQFNNEQIGGIGGVSNDFTLVYNSLGSWTSVYIFSLTLSLGLAIIRHVRPIHRSKEE